MLLARIRPRFTVRRLMVVVAIVGVLLGSGRWIVVMRARSAEYRRKAFDLAGIRAYHSGLQANWHVTTRDGKTISNHQDENYWLEHAWARRLSNKYWQLSLRPWRPVGPDPPRPEPLARPRPAADCPAELTLEGTPCGWCALCPWFKDEAYPWWTFPWTWPPPRLGFSPSPPRYAFP